MIEVRKIKTKEEYAYANKMAKKNEHSIPNATHVSVSYTHLTLPTTPYV